MRIFLFLVLVFMQGNLETLDWFKKKIGITKSENISQEDKVKEAKSWLYSELSIIKEQAEKKIRNTYQDINIVNKLLYTYMFLLDEVQPFKDIDFDDFSSNKKYLSLLLEELFDSFFHKNSNQINYKNSVEKKYIEYFKVLGLYELNKDGLVIKKKTFVDSVLDLKKSFIAYELGLYTRIYNLYNDQVLDLFILTDKSKGVSRSVIDLLFRKDVYHFLTEHLSKKQLDKVYEVMSMKIEWLDLNQIENIYLVMKDEIIKNQEQKRFFKGIQKRYERDGVLQEKEMDKKIDDITVHPISKANKPRNQKVKKKTNPSSKGKESLDKNEIDQVKDTQRPVQGYTTKLSASNSYLNRAASLDFGDLGNLFSEGFDEEKNSKKLSSDILQEKEVGSTARSPLAKAMRARPVRLHFQGVNKKTDSSSKVLHSLFPMTRFLHKSPNEKYIKPGKISKIVTSGFVKDALSGPSVLYSLKKRDYSSALSDVKQKDKVMRGFTKGVPSHNLNKSPKGEDQQNAPLE